MQQQRKKGCMIAGALAAGGMLLSALVCGGFVALATGAFDEELAVNEQERALLLGPEQLEEALGVELEAESRWLETVKTEDLFGVTTLELEYEELEEDDTPLYIYQSISYDTSVQDARTTYDVGLMAFDTTVNLMGGGEVELHEAPELFECCDQSSSRVVIGRDESGAPQEVGHVIAMREGAITMMFFFVGASSRQEGLWQRVVGERFKEAVRQRPR